MHLHPALVKRLGLSPEQISNFCQRWQIVEVALFGSVLRSDFRSDSDIDLLISYAPEARKGLVTKAQIKHELEDLCGREVDVVVKKSIQASRNSMRRKEILCSAQVIYVA
ncbi:MAG: nucleotidyltransferase family protein [Leptolyngbyaceae cyanobacterium]